MKKPKQPLLVAIVGGSGSGKSWLADELKAKLGSKAGRLSLDDFYRDLSHLPPAKRATINFDNPKAIDWPAFERVLRSCVAWRDANVPRYDFKTHCRLTPLKTIRPKPIMLIDGLWLLRSPRIRKLFEFGIFQDAPEQLRFRRRLKRDLSDRGRSLKSVRDQFRKTVEPMHRKYVLPQIQWADLIHEGVWTEREIENLATFLRLKLP